MTTTVTQAPGMFGPQWAQAVREAVDADPDEELRASKLPTYWEWIEKVRADYDATWVLSDAELPAALGGGPAHLLLEWQKGRCVRAAVVDAAAVAGADYVLAAPNEVWRELVGGANAGQLVMYRRIRLERGNVLRFFRGIYFVVEALDALGRVPARVD
ncbi:hypothetical protein [Pseudonocardia alaniniphila]|uniref:SnoaL-like domain-containing protein n=1 Tax=Pseudonocardia alaniniphila TaxID=75291 RepID=A0ABS9TP26_9PSEU|nr:hypothetical protein [Pseudonocardia alaniniphila]MCH6170143.1 hypothetical protein [Pseudonocardia alaniniphila]